MVWVTPRLTPGAVGAIYASGHAAKAEGLGSADRPVPARYRRILARLAELTGGPGRLLEIGAFDGLFLQAGLDAGWEVAGTEIDAAAAADAASRGIPMHVGPLESAPYAVGQFDAIALRDVIEHLPDPRGDLARIAAWLRPGGPLYVWTPNFDSLTRRLYGQRWGAVVFPWHFSYFTAQSLTRMLETEGIQVVSLASRNLLLRRADPVLALAGGGPPAPGPTARRVERWLARAVNPAFALLDRAGMHWGAQIEVFAVAGPLPPAPALGEGAGGRGPAPRVRILIRRFHPVIGGMERQCAALCRRLADRGADIEVWTRHIVPGTAEIERLDGFTVRRLRPGGVGRWGEYGSLPVIARRLVRDRADYDVAAVFGSGWLAVAAGLAAGRVGRPWLFRPATAGDITRFLDPAAMPAGGRLRGWLRGRVPSPRWRADVLRRASTVVAVSDEIAAELAGWGFAAERIVAIPNGVDTGRFAPAGARGRQAARLALGLPLDSVIVLFLGRLVARKGVLDLVAAWRAVGDAADLSPACLVIAGTGDGQRDSVEAAVVQAVAEMAEGKAGGMVGGVTAVKEDVAIDAGAWRAASGAGATIRLAGALEDPVPWLAASDIFVLPSHQEGLSNALLEAMAAGLAIVATDLASTRAAAPPDVAAWLYPPGDVDALAAALRRAIADGRGRARLGRAARARVEAEYGLDAAAERYLALFEMIARA